MTAKERERKYVKQSLALILATVIILVFFGFVVYCIPSSWYRNIEGYITIPKWEYQRDTCISTIVGAAFGGVLMEVMWFMIRLYDLANEKVKENREKLKQEILEELKKK